MRTPAPVLFTLLTSLAAGCSQSVTPSSDSSGGRAGNSSAGAQTGGLSSGGTGTGGTSTGGSALGGGIGAATGGTTGGSASTSTSTSTSTNTNTSTGGAASGGSGASGAGSGGNASGGATGGGAGGSSGGAAGAKGLGACTLPAGANFADAQANYQKWKTDLLTADGAGGFLRVKRPNSGSQINSSNSEGIAYGMEIAVYMDDQATFDKIWQYEQSHRGSNGLMDWEIGPDGSVLGAGAATDGDEDMAFALVMADKKWGGQGSLPDTYLNYAKQLIELIWQHEVDHGRNDLIKPGDRFADGQIINISYFAPAYYRIFGQVTGKTAEWNRAVKTTYDVLEATLNAANKNATNGLVPAWSTPAGAPMAPAGTGHPTHHQLDSCRTPFRVAQDYCWFNEPRALAYLQKISEFYAGVGAANIVEGYNLDGSVFPGAALHLASFVGGAGVGAMAVPSQAKLRDDAYSALAGWQTLIGGSIYYNESWSMLSLLMMTGRFVDLSAK